MLAYAELRNQLIRFLSDDLSLDDFEDWFVQNSWNVHQGPDLIAQRLSYAVELRLAEHDNGHLPDADFQRELRQLVNDFTTFGSSPSVIISTGSSTEFNQPTLAWPLSADMPRATASELPIPH